MLRELVARKVWNCSANVAEQIRPIPLRILMSVTVLFPFMRIISLVLLALVGMSLTSTYADAGAWCANYLRGVSNCGYSSYAQCWATVNGLAGYCSPNPFPGTAYGTSAGNWNVPNSPRRYRRY
jgi:hypothetical protein